ncbi:lipopolysaccharide biosynthesis protein [Actinomadura sp. 9N407]|uniref:lipopolysaccharide biosynthesis protein n=1 Tax=Actinomadura sp. 9N407 TaxID=3375154 RepID=UPI0037923B3B
MTDPQLIAVRRQEAPASAPGWLRRELSNPLFRNAYALVANGGLTGLLGLAYWALGAKLYAPDDMGRNWAVIQAIMFVGSVTMLNFLLIRFIPQTARHTRALVLVCYGTGAVAAALLAAGFLLTLDRWGESFQHLDHWRAGLWFVAMAVAWNLWNQQEGVFTGLRHAGWVPIVNVAFGVTKLVLLVALASAYPGDGVTLSWFVPASVMLIPVSVFVFGRLIPAHRRANFGRGARPTHRDVAKYVGGAYVGGAFQYASISLIPVVVAAHISSTTNAYFQMAWALGMMLDLLALTLSLSLTVEGSFDQERLAESARAALRRTLTLMTPVVVLVVVAAPFGLRFFGHEYADRGAPLLQILALAVLPKALIELYIGVLRVENRTRLIALLQAVRFAGVLAMVLIVVQPDRLATIGLAIVGVNTLVAATVLPGLLRATRSNRSGPAGGSGPAANRSDRSGPSDRPGPSPAAGGRVIS